MRCWASPSLRQPWLGGQGPEGEAGASKSLRPWWSWNFARGLVRWRTSGTFSWPQLAKRAEGCMGQQLSSPPAPSSTWPRWEEISLSVKLAPPGSWAGRRTEPRHLLWWWLRGRQPQAFV